MVLLLIWWDNSYNSHVVGTEIENVYAVGDDFIEEYKKNIKAFEEIIEIKRDIISSGWHGDKIEFLLVDAMKKPVIAKVILEQFYPCLIPGKSLIYHQDFDHYLTPWVHIIIYIYKPFFQHIHDVPGSGGNVFLLKKALPENFFNIDFMAVDNNIAENAFKYCHSLTSKSKQNGVAAAHVAGYIYKGSLDIAFNVWINYLWKGFKLNNDLLEVKMMLDQALLKRG